MAYAIIQGKSSATNSSTATQTTTPNSTITTGNNIFATVHYATSGGSAIAVSNFKDQGANVLSFVQVLTGTFNVGTELGTRLYYLENAPAGITAITVTLASASNFGISLTLEEGSGLAASGSLVGSNSSNNTATNATDNISSGTATPTGQPAMVYGVGSDDTRSNHVPTAGTGFTAGTTFVHPGGGASGGQTENKRITALTAVAATYTNIGTSGDTCPCIMGIFLESGGGLPPQPLPPGAKQTFVTETIIQF